MNQNHHEFDAQMLVSKRVPIGYKYVIPKGTRVYDIIFKPQNKSFCHFLNFRNKLTLLPLKTYVWNGGT